MWTNELCVICMDVCFRPSGHVASRAIDFFLGKLQKKEAGFMMKASQGSWNVKGERSL